MGLTLAVILGLLPSFGWLIFYLQEDRRHPEPKKLIFYTFLGGVLSTIFVLQIQIWIENWNGGIFAQFSPPSLFIFALVEETAKFLTAYIVVGRRKELDEPVDAMIYMIVAALGFSAVENAASVFRTANSAIGIGPLETITFRFIGATLLHTLVSGLVGYYWGMAMVKNKDYFKLIATSLIIATLLHAIFNYFIINSETVTIPIVFLVFTAFFVLNDFEKLKRLK